MLITTLLNQIEKFKSFVYKDAHFELVNGEEAIVVDIEQKGEFVNDFETPRVRI